ncbi:MAG: FxLYD domain-containing protein [Thermoanaerobaculia bacterium]
MTKNLRSTLRFVAVLGAGALAPLAPAAPDWLVTRDGSAIETDGPWRLDGDQVVFTLRGGGLAALPVADLDLEASRERASPTAVPEPAPAAASRWTITDADVARSLDLEEEGGAGSAGDGAPQQTSALTGVSVVSWEETTPPELGVALSGSLRNDGNDYAANLRVHVALHNETGDLIERRTAVLSSTTLAPGEDTDFAVDFPELVGFAEARFAVEGRGFAGGPAAGGDEVGAEAVEGEESLEEEAVDEIPDEIPDETFDETYGEGIEEEPPAQEAALEAPAA